MNVTSNGRAQDLPPKGGYNPIQIERVKLRSFLGAKSTLALFLTTTFVGFYAYYETWKVVKRDEVEMRSARLAIWPLLLAERDRAVMRQMRRNRDEEADLMKKVEGWEVGTYYGEPIYYLDDANTYRDPLLAEHFAHTETDTILERIGRHFLT